MREMCICWQTPLCGDCLLSSHINDDGDPISHELSLAPDVEQSASTDLRATYHVSADDPWLRSDNVHLCGSCYKGKDDVSAAVRVEDCSTNVN